MCRVAAICFSTCLVLVASLVCRSAIADEAAASSKQEEWFETMVRPLLAAKCYGCHGAEKQKGGLRLDSRTSLLAGGESGAAVVPGEPADSLLVEAINYDGLEMPPTGKLSEREIALLTTWVQRGATWPNESSAAATNVRREFEITDENRNYWAFQPPQRAPLPDVERGDWLANAVDVFVLARLELRGLEPNPPADRRTLIRRAYYDLVGLPPTAEEVEQFLADEAPDAWEKIVECLLASPRYGERWGRHWLDVVRFAQTDGYERDAEKKNAWRYRDYVIGALNDDKPYNRFVLEQLAGDELDDLTHDAITATAFYRLGVWDDEPDDKLKAQFEELDEIVRTTGAAFLGLTVGCARCHNHAFDPIAQEDYYRLAAFFRNIAPYGKNQSSRHWVPDEAAIFTPLATRELLTKWQSTQRQLQDRIKNDSTRVEAIRQPTRERIFSARLAQLPAELREAYELPSGQRSAEQTVRADEARKKAMPTSEEIDEQLDDDARAEIKKLSESIHTTEESLKRPPFAETLSVREQGPDPISTHILIRGDAHSQGKEVHPGFPQIFTDLSAQLSVSQQPPRESELRQVLRECGVRPTTGMRRQLAEWIVDPEHPLTSRVIVNRIWQHHFGQGLVRTPNNFGNAGVPPTHPKLLDWLARELIEGGWSLKRLHKLIMTSSTYCMSSRADNEQAVQIDPGNDLLWRQQMRRLDAEALRDSLLAVSGQLTATMGGRGFFPELSQDVLATQSRPGSGWGKSSPAERARRSVYIFVKRTLMVPMLESFDYNNTAEPVGSRAVTTVAPQALMLLNSRFAAEQAEHLADRIIRLGDLSRQERINSAFRMVLARQPTAIEHQVAGALCDRPYDHLKDATEDAAKRAGSTAAALPPPGGADPDAERAALCSLCLVLLNLNEFVFVD
jgi:hypothetical protein